MSALGRALLGLHAWGGLVFSWLLVPIFVAGSLAVFEPEISHWMRPEIEAAPFSRADAVALGEARLREVGAGAALWRLRLPSAREPAIVIAWGDNPRALREEVLDAGSGRPLAPRATDGGHFFTAFHSELLLGAAGRWIVGAVGVFMLAALVSGVLIHHRIFSDFFTFRPRANRRRAWLDAHNLAGVATLPFLLAITYTGVVILAETFMPAATRVLYAGKTGAYRADVVQSFTRPASGESAAMRPLGAHLAAAESQVGTGKVISLTVHHPDDRLALVQAHRTIDDRLAAVADHVTFEAASGALFGKQTDWNGAAYAYRAQVGLHVAHFGGAAIRWTYFLSGLAGAAMMAAGIVLFLRKRRQRHAGGRLQRGLEAFGIAAVAGGLLACLAYFYANRLLPAAADGRAGWEVAAFFAAWGASLAHAAWRGWPAWRDQLLLAGLLALVLTPLDGLSGGMGDALRLGFDLTALVLGGLLLWIGRRLFGGKVTR